MDHFGNTAAGRRNRRRQAEGRGTGQGAQYKPQLNIHDVPSRGRSTRMPIDGRMAHTLSSLETRLLLELRWAPEFSDIREQVPLPLDATLKIAEDIGAIHPVVPDDGAPAVVTTDIVCRYTDPFGSVICARSVKPSKDIEPKLGNWAKQAEGLLNLLAKLEIEKRYWQAQGTDWRIVCEQHLDCVRAANIHFLLTWEGFDPARGTEHWEGALDTVWQALRRGEDTQLSVISLCLEEEGRLSPADFMDCVRHLCSTRQLRFDMRQHFGPDLRACDFFAGDH